MRDLVRLRQSGARQPTPGARQHLQSFLLRHGLIYQGRTLGAGRIGSGWPVCASPLPRSRSRFRTCCRRSKLTSSGCAASTPRSLRLLPDWSMAPVVEVYQALREDVSQTQRHHPGGGTRRPRPASHQPAPVDERYLGVTSSGALQRQASAPGRHHQSRQRPRPARARGRREKLSTAGPHRQGQAGLFSSGSPSPCGTSPGRRR